MSDKDWTPIDPAEEWEFDRAADRSAAEALSAEEEQFVRDHRDITRFGHGYVGDLSMAGGLIRRLLATLDRERAAALPTLERAARWLVKVHGDSVPKGSALWEDIEALRVALSDDVSPGVEPE